MTGDAFELWFQTNTNAINLLFMWDKQNKIHFSAFADTISDRNEDKGVNDS